MVNWWGILNCRKWGKFNCRLHSIRIDAGSRVKDLIDNGIISNEDEIVKKKYFKELLSSENNSIRIDAWYIVTSLIDKGIISNEDAIDKKEYFKEFLSSENNSISAWNIVTSLIDKGIYVDSLYHFRFRQYRKRIYIYNDRYKCLRSLYEILNVEVKCK